MIHIQAQNTKQHHQRTAQFRHHPATMPNSVPSPTLPADHKLRRAANSLPRAPTSGPNTIPGSAKTAPTTPPASEPHSACLLAP